MPLHIIREDITRMAVDAIVTAGSARPGTPMPTGGVNGSIHKKAGARLLEALRRLGGVKTARVTLTKGYDLPCKYVIHTAGPKWRGGSYGEEQLLRSCYEEALRLAKRKGFASIAFPLISSGKYGYPKPEALQVAVSTIRAFLNGHDMDVYLVVYDRETFELSDTLYSGVAQYINQHYVDERYVSRQTRESNWADQTLPPMPAADFYGYAAASDADSCAEASSGLASDWDFGETEALGDSSSWDTGFEDDWDRLETAGSYKTAAVLERRAEDAVPLSLEEQLKQLDAGFADTLLHLIDQSGMKDSECYFRANVDRKLFNKIKNTPGYTPKKSTVVAFCVALRLNLQESRELLAKAGYGMSRSNIFDVIVEYFIVKGLYDVDVINQVLFQYDQPQLGSKVS